MDVVNEYSNITQTDIDSMQETLDAQRRGYHQVTLTEMDTTTIPQVAAGSMVEVGGSLYEAGSAESISGSASSGINYIYLVPGTDIVTPTWTTTAPTWSDAKQGWYGTGGSAGYRYIEFSVDYDGASSYDEKRFLDKRVFEKTLINVGLTTSYFPSSSYANLNFDKTIIDRKSEYNLSTDLFTVQQDGYYILHLQLFVSTNTSEGLQFGFSKSALPTSTTDTNILAFGDSDQTISGTVSLQHTFSITTKVYLDKNDVIYPFSKATGTNSAQLFGDNTRYNCTYMTVEQII